MRNRSRILIYILPVAVLALFVLSYVVFIPRPSANEPAGTCYFADDIPEIVDVEFDEFGIPIGNYRVEQGVVGPRQTLSHILENLGKTRQEIHQIAQTMQKVFDPRRVRRGNHYYTYFADHAIPAPTYFIYEISDLDYVMLEFSDSLQVTRGQKELNEREKKAAGIIHSSLWNTMMEQGLHPDLVIHMSRVLAWSVDFYRIESGDRFKVLYSEQYVGDRSIGVSRVDAVHFIHRGREIEAYRFVSDTINGYFDGDGNNMRKTFLRAPLEFGRITSRYSHSRLHPIHGDRRPHYGTDYAAPHGTPILAVGDGVITRTSYTRGNGNYVRIRHNAVYETQYLHMSRFATGIKPGVRVSQGDVIGYVGSTGLATGPHVCFRFWKNGQQIDHLRLEFPSGDPLPEVYIDAFTIQRERYRTELSTIHLDDYALMGL